MIHVEYYLIVSAIMMFAGIYGFLTRRSTLAILLSIELMLNSTPVLYRHIGGRECHCHCDYD